MQDDVLLASQTPQEILKFSARLRLNQLSKEQQDEKVAYLIELFNLTKCKDTQVGAPGIVRGISGGERKRVAVT
jgi:ABC-type multidrug transport system ATPase subunit